MFIFITVVYVDYLIGRMGCIKLCQIPRLMSFVGRRQYSLHFFLIACRSINYHENQIKTMKKNSSLRILNTHQIIVEACLVDVAENAWESKKENAENAES